MQSQAVTCRFRHLTVVDLAFQVAAPTHAGRLHHDLCPNRTARDPGSPQGPSAAGVPRGDLDGTAQHGDPAQASRLMDRIRDLTSLSGPPDGEPLAALGLRRLTSW